MRTLRTIASVRTALRPPRRREQSIALVPTMGALHEGHTSLIRQARAEYDEVVVSLFVNPTQFGDAADLAAYPRDEARDAGMAADAGADLLFAPSAEELYPAGFATHGRAGARWPRRSRRPTGAPGTSRGWRRSSRSSSTSCSRRSRCSGARTPSRRW